MKKFGLLIAALFFAFCISTPVFADGGGNTGVYTTGGAGLNLENGHGDGLATANTVSQYEASGRHYAAGGAEDCGYTLGGSYNNGQFGITGNAAGVSSEVYAVGRNTAVTTSGQAWQGNSTGVGTDGTYASGGNFSVGSYWSSDEGRYFSHAEGGANANGMTTVQVNNDTFTNSSSGMTASGSNAYGDETIVAGAGGIETGAYKSNGGSSAGAGTLAEYSYQGTNSGGGYATGQSSATIVSTPMGDFGSSSAHSSAGSGVN